MDAVIIIGLYWVALTRISVVFWQGWFRMMPNRFRWSDRRLERFAYYMLGLVSITAFFIQIGRFIEPWL